LIDFLHLQYRVNVETYSTAGSDVMDHKESMINFIENFI